MWQKLISTKFFVTLVSLAMGFYLALNSRLSYEFVALVAVLNGTYQTFRYVSEKQFLKNGNEKKLLTEG